MRSLNFFGKKSEIGRFEGSSFGVDYLVCVEFE